MSNYHHLFVTIALVALLAGETLAIKCYPGPIAHRAVRKEECMRAISQIVYDDDADKTLNPLSKQVDYTYGECNISIINTSGITINKAQVKQRFSKILDQCPSTGGYDYDQINFHVGMRSLDRYKSWDSDFPARLPTCAVADRAANLSPDDCIKAFSDIPTDAQGRLLDQDNRRTHSVEVTSKTCTLAVYTLDFSLLDATKAQLEDDFRKTLDLCDKKCGVIRIEGGAEGPNGRVYLSFRHVTADKSCTIRFSPLLN